MKRFLIPLAAVVAAALALGSKPALAAEEPQPPEQKFTGPFAHKNLVVFIVHGPDRIKTKEFLTLKEALERNKAVVVETGTVNELSIKNASGVPIYVHAGLIVKGGKQDRVIREDYIIPPNEEMKVQAFCVERGRWTGRGGESAANFNKSEEMLATKELKLAARSKGEQQEVWKQVSEAQEKLSRNTGKDVRSDVSRSSLQLTLEDKQVRDGAQEYVQALAGIIAGKDDAVGFAFAINGKVNSVDIYGSGALFAKLWPQLLNATAIEALANYEKDKKFATPTVQAVKTFIAESRQAEAKEKQLAKDLSVQVRESAKISSFRTVDKSQPGAAPVRENAISKE